MLRYTVSVVSLILIINGAQAEQQDVITTRQMTLTFALQIAQKALEECNNAGYSVSAVVVDRAGITQVALRDTFASRFTLQISEEKANAAIMAGIPSGEFRKNRPDIRPELNHVNGILIMEGGLPIRAGGVLVGAIGVSGAPGGDKDEACARKAINSVLDRLEFAD